jgi:hypothetical protein
MRVGISGVAIRKWLFSATGTDFEYLSTGGRWAARKGRIRMSVQGNIKRNLVALCAALTMSTLAVGAAGGPAQAASLPVQATANA